MWIEHPESRTRWSSVEWEVRRVLKFTFDFSSLVTYAKKRCDDFSQVAAVGGIMIMICYRTCLLSPVLRAR